MIYPLQQNTYFIQQPNWQCNQHKCEYIRWRHYENGNYKNSHNCMLYVTTYKYKIQ